MKNITGSLQLLRQLTQNRLQHHFRNEGVNNFSLDEWKQNPAPVNGTLLDQYQLSVEEFIILQLALVPHISPNFLEAVIQEFLPQGGDFAEIGGVRGINHRSMIATGETAQFIIGGSDIERRMQVQAMLQPGSRLVKENLVYLEPVKEGEPVMSGKLIVSDEFLDKILFNRKFVPRFSPSFPAKLITTKMEWSDAVLNPKTAQQIRDIKVWLQHNDTLLNQWGMNKKIKPGFRALFYGPPGTGKTLIASLLGKEFNKDVYRIDLSQVVSKYIGETEKNLEKIFERAENKDWILFFDEADALFGKRSNVQNAHDKYANQEVSYLLQRVEDFPGLILLASNFKANIDQAFVRRFNSIIHFPMPNQHERLLLWKNSLPPIASFAGDIDLNFIASKYELSGSAIISVIQYSSLFAISNGGCTLSKVAVLEGIKREYEKEERVFPG